MNISKKLTGFYLIHSTSFGIHYVLFHSMEVSHMQNKEHPVPDAPIVHLIKPLSLIAVYLIIQFSAHDCRMMIPDPDLIQFPFIFLPFTEEDFFYRSYLQQHI